MRRLASVLSSIALLAMLAPSVVAASPITVDCTTDQTALRAAVSAVPSGSTLVISGTCVGLVDIDRDLTITPGTSDATLTAEYTRFDGVMHVRAGASVLLEGLTVAGARGPAGSTQVLNDGTLILEDSTITNGASEAIRNSGSLTLRRSAVTDNGDDGDAAITNHGGSVTLIQSLVSGNHNGEVVGAIANDQRGTVTLIDSTVSDNYGLRAVISNAGTMRFRNSAVSGNDSGVAPIDNSGTMSFRDSTVAANAGFTEGGGIHNSGTLVLRRSVVRRNTGFNGGGIYNAGTLVLRRSRVRGNTAAGDGGGIYNVGTADLGHVRVRLNVADGVGGGVFNAGAITLRDVTIRRNTPNNRVGC
jgi:hypothetical protein